MRIYMRDNKSFSIKFNLEDGRSPDRTPTRRMLSDMKGIYLDNKASEEMLGNGDKCIYEFFELGIPEKSSDLAFGTTILYSGKVGNEFFMTKGHFHKKLQTAEVYYCTKGHGYLLMEDPEGKTEIQEMTPGISVYVPPNFAHRSINISDTEPLIMFFVFRADAGHDYKTIETQGFRKLVIERNGKPDIIDNPKWKE
jgi:glucose-6-phosphate isomerase